MKKEKLTVEHIRQDLIKTFAAKRSIVSFVICTIIGFAAGAVLFIMDFARNPNFDFVIGLLLAIAVGIGLVLCWEICRLFLKRKQKKELESSITYGSYSISIDRLTSIQRRTAYSYFLARRYKRDVTLYSFSSGFSWIDRRNRMHYEWSREYRLTPQGLENISVAGNYFYVVSLRDDPKISYIYPCKFFESDECPDYFSE